MRIQNSLVRILVAVIPTFADACTPASVATSANIPSPPASGWRQYAAPESAGFSSAALEKAYRYADSVKSGAVMVVYRGTVVAAWGDVARKLELHSVRKSIVSAMLGMAADRGAFLDQSQSLNLFVESPSIGKLSSMYFYAWEKGLKTTYYLRSRPATRIAKATVEAPASTPAADVACSLENPESCEACQ